MLTPEQERKLNMEANMREVYDLRVLVVGGGFQYLKMFFDAGFRGATSVEDANIVCFTGGEDVDPQLYGEVALPCTGFSPRRDEKEAFIYGEAIGAQKPMIGICRGGQFLNVMNGGKLWQDVNNHAIRGTHPIQNLKTGDIINGMTSTHHQMMIPARDADVIALGCLSTRKQSATELMERETPELDDTEVVWYPDSLSLCFQPHPEFSHGECRDFFLDLVDEYILPAATV
jgi:hypothetical protein